MWRLVGAGILFLLRLWSERMKGKRSDRLLRNSAEESRSCSAPVPTSGSLCNFPSDPITSASGWRFVFPFFHLYPPFSPFCQITTWAHFTAPTQKHVTYFDVHANPRVSLLNIEGFSQPGVLGLHPLCRKVTFFILIITKFQT